MATADPASGGLLIGSFNPGVFGSVTTLESVSPSFADTSLGVMPPGLLHSFAPPIEVVPS
jgi:hypothetical protein